MYIYIHIYVCVCVYMCGMVGSIKIFITVKQIPCGGAVQQFIYLTEMFSPHTSKPTGYSLMRTHTHVYVYVCLCLFVCVCVCVKLFDIIHYYCKMSFTKDGKDNWKWTLTTPTCANLEKMTTFCCALINRQNPFL